MVLGVSRSSRIFPWIWFPISRINRSSVYPCGMLPGDVMEQWSEPTDTAWPFPFTPQDWEQTPLTVQAYVRTLRDEVVQLHDRMETLKARLTQNSATSSRPPSSDNPYKKPRPHTTTTTPRKA